jgi:hypothetical protein
MSKTKGIYEKEKGKGFYGDFRPYGGKLEALIPTGERRATTDYGIAQILKGRRIEELKKSPKPTREQEAMLGAFAEYHLKQKKDNNEATDWTLGGVELSLERAVKFFGASKTTLGNPPERCNGLGGVASQDLQRATRQPDTERWSNSSLLERTRLYVRARDHG